MTAIGLRVLYLWSHKRSLDSHIMTKSLSWLLNHQGSEDGAFEETYLYQGEMDHTLPVHFRKAALTAQVYLLLNELAEEVHILKPRKTKPQKI